MLIDSTNDGQTDYIMYDMNKHTEIGKPLTINMVEWIENDHLDTALFDFDKIYRVGYVKISDQKRDQFVQELEFDVNELREGRKISLLFSANVWNFKMSDDGRFIFVQSSSNTELNKDE